ncbi:hypothetical protein C8R46DRAFT_1070689 [Mycena filopes]|nr:hypothetical protein C8R46DRAFT_1070689 [Mycena filopes]
MILFFWIFRWTAGDAGRPSYKLSNFGLTLGKNVHGKRSESLKLPDPGRDPSIADEYSDMWRLGFADIPLGGAHSYAATFSRL